MPGKPVDHRVLRHHRAVVPVGCCVQCRQEHRVIGEHQQMPLHRMLVMPCDAVFGAQALDELEIAFTVLAAVRAWWQGLDMEPERIGKDAVTFEHLGDDLRDSLVLENLLIVTELQIVEDWNQCQAIVRQALSRLACLYILDAPVNTFAIQSEAQERRLTKQRFHVEIMNLADEFYLDGIKRVDGLGTLESQHLEVVANGGNLQRKARRTDSSRHTLVLKQRGNLA